MPVPIAGRARRINLTFPIRRRTPMRVPVSWPCALLASLLLFTLSPPATPAGYQKPPEAIRNLLDLPPAPAVSLSPGRDYLVLAEQQRYPTIADLARPTLRLAGLRIDPKTNGPQ